MASSRANAFVTRREAIRKTLVFSAGSWAASRFGSQRAEAARTDFAQEGIHLLAFGDYGTKGNAEQTTVARRMAAFAQSLDQPLSAVLAMGDNFYRRLTPDRFDRHFEKMYSEEYLNCPFYACAGNHDYGTALYDFQRGKLQMQLDYAKSNPQSRWKFPAKWYALELPEAENPLVKTITLDGSYWSGALTPREKLAQRRFFEAELEKPTKAPWLWIVNHYPMFSETTKRGDNQELIREWGPLLKNSSAALFLAGHDHTMQHLQVEGYPCSFIVSGAGGAGLYDVKSAGRGFCDCQNLGFNHLHVTRKHVDVQFINAEGETIHAFRRDVSGKTAVMSAA